MSKYKGTLELMPPFALVGTLIAFQYQFRKFNPTFKLISSATEEFTISLMRDTSFPTAGDFIKEDIIFYCTVSLEYKLASCALALF
jgi:hypothetical protein